MGNKHDSAEKPGGLSRFERAARRDKWVVRIGYTIAAAAFAYWLYGVKVDFDEGEAILEACGEQASFECMDKALAEFRKNH